MRPVQHAAASFWPLKEQGKAGTGVSARQRAHQLVAHGGGERVLAAAGEQVRVEAQRAQHGHAVLRRLRLLLAHHAQHGHQAHVHAAEGARPHAELELRHHAYTTGFSPLGHLPGAWKCMCRM